MNLLWWVATWGGEVVPITGSGTITLADCTLVAYDVAPWVYGRKVLMSNVEMM